ncbi:hypothetical protein T4D_11629 [Trichinella pseudospiralis]|uniref:Uncharacterized protein n=1 Tax=Trichinella pseudospiralis TaxID=6337 RepID=A0A0V1F9B8_TRIPS|nr:hypothetical protein T4D_11629 [Trichinella pseudospiralis]
MAPLNPSQCGRKLRLRWMARPPFSAGSVSPLHAGKQNSFVSPSSLRFLLSASNTVVSKLPKLPLRVPARWHPWV